MKSIQEFLEITFARSASDLHLVVGFPPCLRIDGELIFLREEEVLDNNSCERLIFSLLSGEQKELLQENKEVDFSFDLKDRCRFRVNAYYQKGALSAALRTILQEVRSIDHLGLPPICHEFAMLKQGLVLVVGPTGHGKSTTLAAILKDAVERRSCHLVTIEDPIEFIIKSKVSLVSQRELHKDTHSWANALRAVLREDPDVVLIGEMRDYETMAAALTIAETGHLVFSTLHTNSAAQSVDRIIDSFPEEAKNFIRSQLSLCLEAVFSQRLVPLVAGGRTLAYELLIATPAVRNSIREGKSYMLDNIIQTSSGSGMITLESSLSRLAEERKITAETARLFALRPEEIGRRARI